MTKRLLLAALLGSALLLPACSECNSSDADDSPTATSTPEDPTPAEAPAYDGLERLRFNQLAVQTNTPVFWASDADEDGAIDADEVRQLLFYPESEPFVADGALTDHFRETYEALVAANGATAPTDPRLAAVVEELSTTAPTLVETDLSDLPADHQAFADHMLRVADMIDGLYARQVGMTRLQDQVADDDASRSLFRRNWGPACRGATTERNEACSAIVGAPREPVDVYPIEMQSSDGFCATLEARDDSSALLTPFTVVREAEGALRAVPYTEAYANQMGPVATELRAAADALTDSAEEPLRTYLRAAAQAFQDNDWNPADEAWAAMNVRNSRWYVRVAPDEVYWDPCSQKAGFHMTFALINQGSLVWQDRLTPLQQRMEASIAELSDAYEPRDVSFHLPDFIDIVTNSGDDRDAFGATIGQSLPNWGPVSEEGRGRTVAMTNLYTDPDSAARRRSLAESIFTEATLAHYSDDAEPGLLSTILHEATHNLGPSHEYRTNGQTDDEAFGGGLASMLEELKAQSGALFYTAMLREEGIITEDRQNETYLDSIVWAMGHISRGMYTPTGQRKAYSQLAAVQVGFLMDAGVLTWDAEAMAANGTDHGAFSLDYARFPAAARDLMTLVMGIKATGNRAEAERVAARFVDGDVVPQATIVERWNRSPRATFVYAIRR
ncbi:MAG: hypothetical protein H6719_31535 [Sandaracinaceae bacterium]|nr:hypothetical protein [Sandaracinaceae bacterium]